MRKNKTLFIGLGGAGRAAIETVISSSIEAEQALFINTDKKALKRATACQTLLIGEKLLKGFSAGVILFGIKAIDESFDDILLITKQYSEIIIIAGLNGGTGAAVAHLAEKLLKHDLHVAISVIYPHYFETANEQADLVISKIDDIKHQLLFFNSFKVDKDSVLAKSDCSLIEYLERFNLQFMSETMALCYAKTNKVTKCSSNKLLKGP